MCYLFAIYFFYLFSASTKQNKTGLIVGANMTTKTAILLPTLMPSLLRVECDFRLFFIFIHIKKKKLRFFLRFYLLHTELNSFENFYVILTVNDVCCSFR